jgi:hypothetical protein
VLRKSHKRASRTDSRKLFPRSSTFVWNLAFLSKQIMGTVFRKSLRLSGRGRVDNNVGKITTMLSTDASRLDRFSGFAHK